MEENESIEGLDPEDAIQQMPNPSTDVEHQELDDKSIAPAEDVEEMDFDFEDSDLDDSEVEES